ncbi:MAG: acylphosphatase [Gemmatimonadota bacterium]|jgi:acylphosphatase
MSHQAVEARLDCRVTGRVQGVGFRWWTLQIARRFQLRGSIRNCEDGSVEVRVAGGREGIDGLRSALRRGPPAARVDEVRDIPPDGDLPPEFRIEG